MQRPWGGHNLGMLARDSMEASALNVDEAKKRERGKEFRENSEKAYIPRDLINYRESMDFILNMKARQWRDVHRRVRNQRHIF